MTGDASLSRPAGGAGRAVRASVQTPLVDLEFDSGTLHALRAAVLAHVGRSGLPGERASEVVLAVHELAANTIAHGAGHGRLRMWDVAGTLSCEVADGGPADRDGLAGRSGGADPWPVVEGHGLWLVRQVADELDLRSGPFGTRAIVTFVMPRPRDH